MWLPIHSKRYVHISVAVFNKPKYSTEEKRNTAA